MNSPVQYLIIISFFAFVIAVLLLAFIKGGRRRKPKTDLPITSESASPTTIIIKGKQYIAVSKLASAFFPEFNAAEHAEKKAMQTGKDPTEIIDEWAAISQRERQAGLFLHKNIGRFFIGVRMQEKFQHIFNGINVSNEEIVSVGDEERLFKKYIAQRHLRVYKTNYLVSDPSLRIAGRITFIGKKADSYEIIDWKRSSKLTTDDGKPITQSPYGRKGINGLEHIDDTQFWRYAVQLNIYRALLLKTCHINVSSITLVDISARKKNYVEIPIPIMDKEVSIIFSRLESARKQVSFPEKS